MSLSEKNLPKIFQLSVDDSSKSQKFRSPPHTQIKRSKKIFFSRSLLLVIYKTERRSKINSYDRKTVKNSCWRMNESHTQSFAVILHFQKIFLQLSSFSKPFRFKALEDIQALECCTPCAFLGVCFHCFHNNLSVFLKDRSCNVLPLLVYGVLYSTSLI